jgi:hypothetical protein
VGELSSTHARPHASEVRMLYVGRLQTAHWHSSSPKASSKRAVPHGSYVIGKCDASVVLLIPVTGPETVVVVVAHLFEQRLTRLAQMLVRVCLR